MRYDDTAAAFSSSKLAVICALIFSISQPLRELKIASYFSLLRACKQKNILRRVPTEMAIKFNNIFIRRPAHNLESDFVMFYASPYDNPGRKRQ